MCPECKTDRVHASANFCPYTTNGMAGGFGIAAAALPNKGRAVSNAMRGDRELAKDRDAYARLRKDGLRPTAVQGAATVESLAERREHVEMGRAARVRDSQTGERRWVKDDAFNAFGDAFDQHPQQRAPRLDGLAG